MIQIYAVEQNLGTLITRVRFRVYETIGELTRVKDDCMVSLEGRHEMDDEDLPGIIESKYNEAMGGQR